MITLAFTLLGGRYHATPGGYHVNEGRVEWPPSPWRLVRALVATGYAKLHWSTVPPAARRLIERLSAALPTYHLPQAVIAHTRHYMPPNADLVFDAFADVGEQRRFLIDWPVVLDAEERAELERLIAVMGYLGRSESWVAGAVVSEEVDRRDLIITCKPSEGPIDQPGEEMISLDAPLPAAEYGAWRAGAVAKAQAAFPLPDKGKPPKKLLVSRAKAEAPYPGDLIACLEQDTRVWRAFGWSAPPGSRRVNYRRSGDALVVTAPRTRPSSASGPSVCSVLLAITTPSGNTSALPPVARTVPQAELIHRALVSRIGRGERVDQPLVTGRDAHGQPLAGEHLHLHTLPLDLDADGRLDHVLLYAKAGIPAEARSAIRSLRRTWTKNQVDAFQLAVAGEGDLTELRGLPAPLHSSVERLLGGARVWRSATPFVAPRHIKSERRAGGRHTLVAQVQAELESRGFRPAMVEILPFIEQPAAFRHFIRRRSSPRVQPPSTEGFALRLTFDQPQCGPICLGYGAHFGLGRMEAVMQEGMPAHAAI